MNNHNNTEMKFLSRKNLFPTAKICASHIAMDNVKAIGKPTCGNNYGSRRDVLCSDGETKFQVSVFTVEVRFVCAMLNLETSVASKHYVVCCIRFTLSK